MKLETYPKFVLINFYLFRIIKINSCIRFSQNLITLVLRIHLI